MSSKGGVRAHGTDGSDFLHRERVAEHYKISAVNKSRLRLAIYLQSALFLLMITRLLPNILNLLSLSTPTFLKEAGLPNGSAWEYAWCFSMLAAICGLVSLPKNRIFFIQQYIIGSIMFGLFPMAFAVYNMWDDLSLYLNKKKEKVLLLLGFPAVVIWFVFIVVAVQVHGFGVYFASQLLTSWKSKNKKTKSK